MKTFYVTPVAKPRMTRRDKWLSPPRPCVAQYRAFCDELRYMVEGWQVPEGGYHIIFVLPMPASWSEKKKRAMVGRPHQVRPDKDNLEKAFLDALCPFNDAYVWDGRVTKIWGKNGKIVIVELDSDYPWLSQIIGEECKIWPTPQK